MLFTNSYNTIVNNSETLYKSKGSKFLAYVFSVNNEQDIKQQLAELKTKYPDASHHCYAYVLGMDRSIFRSNDDGEPSGTAGRPILRQIQKLELTNVLVVVVRYFGGTLLGVPGLIEAYGESAAEALKLCKIVSNDINEKYALSCHYGEEKDIYRICKQFQVNPLTKQDPSSFSAEIKIPLHKAPQFKAAFKELYHINIQYIGIE